MSDECLWCRATALESAECALNGCPMGTEEIDCPDCKGSGLSHPADDIECVRCVGIGRIYASEALSPSEKAS